MANPIAIGYFLEDIGQERFVTALVARIAADVGLSEGDIVQDVRNATGGVGGAMRELGRFFRECSTAGMPGMDIVVVAIDGNCHGHLERRQGIEKIAQQSGYPGLLACAVPDPHIERWYLQDRSALRSALGVQSVADCPAYKCEKDRYKQALLASIKSSGARSLAGGAEYGPEIAARIDLYQLGKADGGFGHFVESLKSGLRTLMQGQESTSP